MSPSGLCGIAQPRLWNIVWMLQDAETSTCEKCCLLKHFKTLQFSSHGSKGNLADFHPAFIITMWEGYANQQYQTLFSLHPDHPLIWQKGFVRLLGCRVPVYTDSMWVQRKSCPLSLSEWEKGIKPTTQHDEMKRVRSVLACFLT